MVGVGAPIRQVLFKHPRTGGIVRGGLHLEEGGGRSLAGRGRCNNSERVAEHGGQREGSPDGIPVARAPVSAARMSAETAAARQIQTRAGGSLAGPVAVGLFVVGGRRRSAAPFSRAAAI